MKTISKLSILLILFAISAVLLTSCQYTNEKEKEKSEMEEARKEMISKYEELIDDIDERIEEIDNRMEGASEELKEWAGRRKRRIAR
jgi:Na+-translocating ferredoxin:NAD+ oxidoreductase RnfG subunit